MVPLYMYLSLKWLECSQGQCANNHPLIESACCVRVVSRIAEDTHIAKLMHVLSDFLRCRYGKGELYMF